MAKNKAKAELEYRRKKLEVRRCLGAAAGARLCGETHACETHGCVARLQIQLKQEQKRQIVMEHERKMAWEKERTMQRIQDETERAFAIKAAKENIQQQRRLANLEASMQRHRIQVKMEEIQIKGIDIENKDAIQEITQAVYN